MNKSDALRILIAAQDDPVLASWAAVAHEYKIADNSAVSPYECWEALQKLYDYGLITSDQFYGIDAQQAFFSGRRISTGAIQRVLANLKLLPERYEQEIQMSRPKLGNPFADDNALVARESGGVALNGRNGHGPALPARQAHNELGMANPFSPARETLPGEKRSLELEPFAQQAGLPCRDTGPRPSSSNDLGHFRMTCFCGGDVAVEVDDADAEGPDDAVPGGQIQILTRVLHGTCRRCGNVWHASGGRVDINSVG